MGLSLQTLGFSTGIGVNGRLLRRRAGQYVAEAVRDAARPPLVIDEDDGDFGVDQRLLTALDRLA